MQPSPLFLVAPGRSGATLLFDLLSAHPAVGLTDEAGVADFLYHAHRWARVDDTRSVDLDLERPVRVDGVLAPGVEQEFSPLFDRHARDLFLEFHRARFPGRELAWIGDKMPHPLAARAVCDAFGGGELVALVRDPRDFLVSARAYAARADVAAAYPHLQVDDRERLVHWTNFYRAVLEHDDAARLVRYEELVRRPREVAARVLARLGLEPPPAWPSADDLAARFRRHGTATTLEATIGRWRSELDAAQLALVDEVAGPLARELGYLGDEDRRAASASPPHAALPPRPTPGPPPRVVAEPDGVDWWGRAHRVLAAGTWCVGQGAYTYPPDLFPVMARSGSGATLVDTKGRAYVDWMMGWGPVILGYRHPEVEAAIAEQLAEGPLFSLLHPLEVEVAETVRDLVPGADGVAFGKNGSDALTAAVRIARAHTGREHVLVHGYHGFHDWYQASLPGRRGLPSAFAASVERFEWNDLAALGARLAAKPVAAVVLEPASHESPPPGWLEGVRALCDEAGSLLVFDEVLTALRLAPGGAQEAFGVRADLVCLGKSLANGMPLSAVCGPERFLRSIAGVGYGLTFRGETLSLAAARATLRVCRREAVHVHLRSVGEALAARFEALATEHGVAAELLGFPARLTASFRGAGRIAPLGAQTLFVHECLRAGVLTNGNFLPSAAHGAEELERTFAAFDAAFASVARALDAGSFDGVAHFEPGPECFTEEERS